MFYILLGGGGTQTPWTKSSSKHHHHNANSIFWGQLLDHSGLVCNVFSQQKIPFFFHLKTKVEVFGKFHFSSINLTMFSKKIWKCSPTFRYHKIEKKNHVTERHFCTNFFLGRILQRDNKRICGIFWIF